MTISSRCKRRLRLAGIALVSGSVFVMPLAARAANDNLQTQIYNFFGNIVLGILQAVAALVAMVVHFLIIIAQYSDFVRNDVVSKGWDIVVGVANMFFIIALLVIAIGTVLRIQNYRYNRLLGNVIVMAFMVNLSKTIAAFFIQTSQIVMLTFVNAFKDAAFGNFATMFGLDKVLTFSQTAPQGGADILAALLIGLLFLTVACITIIALAVVLSVRIVTLWILVILSPFAYALRILPNTDKWASQWWSEFGKWVVTGPVIAFFLWLALAILSQSSTTNGNATNFIVSQPSVNQAIQAIPPGESTLYFGSTKLLDLDNFIAFIIAIVFLWMGLQQATSLGGIAGKWAGKVATAGFATYGVISGLNMLRDRTVAPVQGYLQKRSQRGKEGVQRRTEGLDYRMGQLTNVASVPAQLVRGTVIGAGAMVKSSWQQERKATASMKQIDADLKAGTITKAEAAERKSAVVGGAFRNIVGQQGLAGGFLTGMKFGSEEQLIRRQERRQYRVKKEKAAEDMLAAEKMSQDERRNVRFHGNADQRFAATRVAAQHGELDPEHKRKLADKETDPVKRQQLLDAANEDAAALKTFGVRVLNLANSTAEAEKYLSGIAGNIRQQVMGGLELGKGELIGQGGKKEIMAGLGFIEEAFKEKAEAGADYIRRHDKQLAEQVEKSLVSYHTLGNQDLIQAIHKLKNVDNDKIVAGTKDDDFAKHWNAGVDDLISSKLQNYDVNTDEGKEQEKWRRSLSVGARFGEFTDKAGVKRNSFTSAYRDVEKDKMAFELSQRTVRSLGKHGTKYDYEKYTNAGDIFHRNLMTKNLSNGALSAIMEKQPNSSVKTIQDRADWRRRKDGTTEDFVRVFKAHGGSWGAEERKKLAASTNATTTSDTLSGFATRIDPKHSSIVTGDLP